MPLPMPSPANDAYLAAQAKWLAHIEHRAVTNRPPPGRAASHPSALAAERDLRLAPPCRIDDRRRAVTVTVP